MNVTKVGTPAAETETVDDAFTTPPPARFAGISVSFVVVMKFAVNAQRVSVVGNRVTAEIDTFFQDFFHGPKKSLKDFLGQVLHGTQRVNTGKPKYLVRVNGSYTGDNFRIHQCLFNFPTRFSQQSFTEAEKCECLFKRFWSDIF